LGRSGHPVSVVFEFWQNSVTDKSFSPFLGIFLWQSVHFFPVSLTNLAEASLWYAKIKNSIRPIKRAEISFRNFPKRWHVEELFNAHQALGWNRADTLNLNIGYGQMSMALVAQAALHQFRQRLGPPYSDWDSSHLALALFNGIDGDIRVSKTLSSSHSTTLPMPTNSLISTSTSLQQLEQEHIDPRIPWLYHFKLDFRFK
jgi:hypothetical protein